MVCVISRVVAVKADVTKMGKSRLICSECTICQWSCCSKNHNKSLRNQQRPSPYPLDVQELAWQPLKHIDTCIMGNIISQLACQLSVLSLNIFTLNRRKGDFFLCYKLLFTT